MKEMFSTLVVFVDICYDFKKVGVVIDEATHGIGFVNPWFSFLLCPPPDDEKETPQ
jgi:hypothetical protein